MSHPVKKVPPAAAKTRSSEPAWLARTLADKTTLLRLSFLANCGLVIYLLIQPHLIIQELYAPQRAIILDGAGTYSIAAIRDMNTATPLHHAAAQDAALALLQRGPISADRPEQISLWFTATGRKKVEALYDREQKEFTAKQFHQKATIESTTSIATGDGQYKATVTGQLIRTGLLNGRVHVETLIFELQISMTRNPDMLTNKRFPYASWDFDISYTR
jgi:hypothetical protein